MFVCCVGICDVLPYTCHSIPVAHRHVSVVTVMSHLPTSPTCTDMRTTAHPRQPIAAPTHHTDTSRPINTDRVYIHIPHMQSPYSTGHAQFAHRIGPCRTDQYTVVYTCTARTITSRTHTRPTTTYVGYTTHVHPNRDNTGSHTRHSAVTKPPHNHTLTAETRLYVHKLTHQTTKKHGMYMDPAKYAVDGRLGIS